MSDTPQIRRTDKLMSEDGVRELISQAYCGRLATVGADSWPYVIPLLYVWMNGEIWVHNTSARGHFRANVDHDPRVCFELDDAGDVFAYGRFECDTSIAYRSVLVFGRIRVIEDRNQKEAFFDALMQKYGDPGSDRPKGFYPRLGLVTVYAIAIDRMTGKQTPLPGAENRWPAADHTKTPDAVPEKPARRPVAADPPQSPRRAGRRPRSDIAKPGDDR